jgi:hypothetical protein
LSVTSSRTLARSSSCSSDVRNASCSGAVMGAPASVGSLDLLAILTQGGGRL